MNSSSKYALVFIIIGGIIIASIAGVIYINSLKKSGGGDDDDDDGVLLGPPTSNPRVNIYVNSTLYSSIKTDVDKYVQNATSQGFVIKVINWSIPDVDTLKLNITNEYGNNSISGVILIGKMPYAMGRYQETYSVPPFSKNFVCPIDMYLMDLDGNWTDFSGDNVYDFDPNLPFKLEHGNGTGDWGPEIWLARIDPYSISYAGFNYINSIKDFFKRTRELRNGTLVRPHKAMLYIDDDWSTWTTEWAGAFTAYTGTQRVVHSNNALTNSTNYMNNLTQICYELVHPLVHSYPEKHAFGPAGPPSGTQGFLRYQDIISNNTTPLFYMMYACTIFNHTIKNNIASHYLFTGGSTITVVASSRSGGVDLYEPYYDALKQGKTFGEGFYTWLQNPEIEELNKEPNYYGMTILGDPFATIYMT
ncbi:MAG: hypothetical protein EU529_04615 [Promethearchaeota archaeon]|nr:MAG: hypothetical protein EU529_04615 [Candidatus Lokiarchaeota archaeon]